MLEALRKADKEGDMEEIDLSSVYDHLAYAEYQVSSGHTQTDRHTDTVSPPPPPPPLSWAI